MHSLSPMPSSRSSRRPSPRSICDRTQGRIRLGAIDVVPFIPISGATMTDCVALARTTAAAVHRTSRFRCSSTKSASTDARRNLADIRRGEFEDWPQSWRCRSGNLITGRRGRITAGAAVIGARTPLIAFNVNLATGRLETAKAIAAAVRHSSGGLPFVKALGIALEHRGVAQVSMNLTNYENRSCACSRRVRHEAERHGTSVLRVKSLDCAGGGAAAGSRTVAAVGGIQPQSGARAPPQGDALMRRNRIRNLMLARQSRRPPCMPASAHSRRPRRPVRVPRRLSTTRSSRS